MACPAVRSGEQFLASALAHVDCQSIAIGAYGHGALADPGSPVQLALNGMLVIFVALYGMRLLAGHAGGGRDVVTQIIKVGIVLTLATSWPAWRVIGHDLVIHGPGEIAGAIGGAANLPGVRGDLAMRLGRADQALFALDQWGAGRLRGITEGDTFQFGLARTAFLTGSLVPLALIRLLSGILLAIAPLMAGLMLFGATRALFAGWLRGLALCFLASVALAIVIGVELALLEPWLADALARRVAGEELLSAPAESLALTAGFALVALGAIAICARLAFHAPGFRMRAGAQWLANGMSSHSPSPPALRTQPMDESPVSHSRAVVQAISEGMRREERLAAVGSRSALLDASRASAGDVLAASATPADRHEPADDGMRRTATRVSASGRRRDLGA